MNEIQQKRKFVEDKNYQLTKREVKDLIQFHTSYLLAYHKQDIETISPVNFLDNTPFLSGYNRIVIGAHGAYIEFEEDHILDIDLVVPEDQKWRLESTNVKYWWFTPVGRCDKVYYQVGKVKYADYKVGKYYIDFYSTRKVL